MRYAIIDNSTLTSVQRLLGRIKIKNKSIIDGDILAFETFLQTILFYDDVFYIDDYKEEYRQDREKFFKYLYPIQLDEESYKDIVNKTKLISNSFIPEVSRKTFSNKNIKEFLELLNMNIIFCWNIQSSEYFLTMKLLQENSGVNIHKYSTLASMIYDELFQRNKTNNNDILNKEPIIYDSKGKRIDLSYKITDWCGNVKTPFIHKDVKDFSNGLIWLDFRTLFYINLTNSLNRYTDYHFDLVLHPIRNAYEINFINRANSYLNQDIKDLIYRLKKDSLGTLNNIKQEENIIYERLPMFSIWIAEKCEDISQFMDIIYSIKGNKEFIRTREILEDLSNLDNLDKKIRSKNLLLQDFKKQMRNLEEFYGFNIGNTTITSSYINCFNIPNMPSVPNIKVNIKKASILNKLYHYNGFGAVFKSIVQDLAHISRLGKYHDILTSKLLIDNNSYSKDIKTEEKRFLNHKCWWKVPL